MANLVLAFVEIGAGAVILDAAIKGDSVANVIRGTATQNPVGGTAGQAAQGGGGGGPQGLYGQAGQAVRGAGGNIARALGASGYVNPVPGAKPGRIDQGVDYVLGPKGFLAPARSRILVAQNANSGWGPRGGRGGGVVAAQILDGPLKGAVYYVAEGIRPASGIHPGATVQPGTPLVVRNYSPWGGGLGSVEAGWGASASNPTTPLAQSLPGYGGDQSTQALTAGYSFARFVQAQGGPGGVFQTTKNVANRIMALFRRGTPRGVPF